MDGLDSRDHKKLAYLFLPTAPEMDFRTRLSLLFFFLVTLVVVVVVVVVVFVAAAAVNANVAMMIVILIVLVLGDDVRILSVLRRVGHNDTKQMYIIASKR